MFVRDELRYEWTDLDEIDYTVCNLAQLKTIVFISIKALKSQYFVIVIIVKNKIIKFSRKIHNVRE